MADDETKPPPKTGTARLSHEQRMAIMQRIESGEKQGPIADEIGVTRQYISILWRTYIKHGEEGLKPDQRGRKKGRRLTKEQAEKIHAILKQHKKPSDYGFKNFGKLRDHWYLDTAMRLIKTELRFTPPRSHVIDLLKGWGIRVTALPWTDDTEFSQDYYDYINSDIGREVLRREAELKAAWEKKNKNFTPKKGRPKKNTSAQPIDGTESPKVLFGTDGYDDDIENIDYDNMDMEAIRKKMAKAQAQPPAPGQRVGKHKKGSNRTKPKRKKKKR
jgi:hypothetical protein